MNSGQSPEFSALEALTGTVVGFVLSIGMQRLLFPSLGLDLALAENALVSSAFTALSLVRGYVLRRIFNRYGDPK